MNLDASLLKSVRLICEVVFLAKRDKQGFLHSLIAWLINSVLPTLLRP